MSHLILDLYAGLGGADLGMRALGLDPVGIELDATVCATRAAAGLRTIRADVARYPSAHLAGRLWGLWASPPCEPFCDAGRAGRGGIGRDGLALLADGATHLAATPGLMVADLVLHVEDPRALLVLEPLRYVRDARPVWVALEQVPPVLPLWRTYALALTRLGYRTWTGTLCAADYGVAQARVRAILLASRDPSRRVAPPAPTHQDPRKGGSLLGLTPWVSMAAALGWDTDGLARTVGGQRRPCWSDPPASAVGRALAQWAWQRPATTVQGTPRIARPGHRDRGGGEHQHDGAVPVTLEELAVLQGIPPGYPIRGSRTQRAAQVGDAVPPPLATAIVAALTGLDGDGRAVGEPRA